MSEYLRVLNRLEHEGRRVATAAPRPAAARSAPALSPVVDERAARPLLAAVHDHRSAAFAALYDNLRAAASDDGTRALVVASVAVDGAARTVIEGLAGHVYRLGLRVRFAEVAEADGRPLLRVRPEAGDPGRTPPSMRPLDLRSHASADDVRAWLATVADADLVLIEGGALSASIDPALLACGCDGLLIVVRTEATGRDALRVASERARSVGCRALGIVVEVQPDRIPPWLRHRSSRTVTR